MQIDTGESGDFFELELMAVGEALRASYEAEVKATGRASGIVHATPEQWTVIMGPVEQSCVRPIGISIETEFGPAQIQPTSAITAY